MSILEDMEKELYQRIDEVIHYIWDPIGINGAPEARDEYYTYLPEIYSLVKDNNEDKIVKTLMDISIKRMGISPSKDSCDETASILVNWNRFLIEKYEKLK
jgi:hypothetical protein